MKKILIITLTFVLLLSATGCNKTPPDVPDNTESNSEIRIGAYIVSLPSDEIKVKDTKENKEYTVSLSFCLDHTPEQGSFYWITGILDSKTNHITVETPENFHCPQRYEHTDSSDWALSVYADNVTDTGLTVIFEMTGAPKTESLQTGEWYEIEKYVDNEWHKVKTVISDYAFNTIAYLIKENDTTQLNVNWEWLYGKLSPGYYRINKEVIYFRETADFEKSIYEIHFIIPDDSTIKN